ncbi:MAG: hypothetical protein KF729_08610 [Sandaracinaceae bacterium]|nr:hypothetical protein [Sandaracinaceae bacterium]
MTRLGASFVAIVLWSGCLPPTHTVSDGGAAPEEIDAAMPDLGASAEALIGPEGGTLALASAEIVVPEGALAEPTTVRVRVSRRAVDAVFTSYSAVYRFEPAGLRFARPVEVRIPFAGDAERATVFWTVGESSSFAALPTRVEGRRAVAEATHFSEAFVGTACEGACCGRGRGDLDLLLVVDNSNSMAEEQALLAAQLPRLARVLATGDVDGDGVQDLPALHSLRVGTISTDMGTGGFHVPTCTAADFGDDGALRTRVGPEAAPECPATLPAYASLASGAASDVDAFVSQVSCAARLGIGGCGFEQQLEAIAKAITPSTAPMTFHGGTRGHADGANAGLARSDAMLAVLVLTDEDDCSASDPGIFDLSSALYGGVDLNLRCAQFPEALHPAARYVSALQAARPDPRDVMLALITGVPADRSGEDAASILDDPRMVERVDPDMPSRLLPSCRSLHGTAMPPRRLLEVAAALPASPVHSICDDDFTRAVDAILRRVAARASGACVRE